MKPIGRVACAGRRRKIARRRAAVAEALDQRLLLAASVSGTVFEDLNGSGITSQGSALAGWRVYADLNHNGSYDAGEPTALSDSNGQYTIGGLSRASYTLRDVVQSGYYSSNPPSGSRSITLSNNQVLTAQDFGNAKVGSISGTVFNDQNGDGVLQPSEPAMGGVTLFIDANSNGVLDSGEQTSVSDASGRYAFTGLPAAAYLVSAVPPAGWQISILPNEEVGIVPGANQRLDWGLTQQNIVRGTVYSDDNANGTQDSSESGLSAVKVYLDLNNNGQPDPGEPSTLSVAFNGAFQLGAPAGTYSLRQIVPGGYVQDQPAAGGYSLTLGALDAVSGLKFGDVPQPLNASVSGYVFNDFNGDGGTPGAYTGLAGWRVYADTNDNGQYDGGEPSTLTDASGAYTLNLAAGTYTLRDVVEAGWYSTNPVAGSRTVSLVNGQALGGQDLGNAEYGSILGTIFNDQNGNGVRDAGEPTLPGFQVYLDLNHDSAFDSGDVVAPANASGDYVFSNLKIGNYDVLEVPMSGWQNSGVSAAGFSITSGASFPQDWAFTQAAVVRGQVFVDNDNNGTYSAGDVALGGWTVFADLNNNGVFDIGEPSTFTDANGFYQLGLAPGMYTIREVAQNGYEVSAPAGGSYSIAAAAASFFGAENFANRLPAPSTISGTVYSDLDGSGTLQPGDTGLANVRVYVDINLNGQYDSGEPTALTDSTGSYTIGGLAPGQYLLKNVIPDGWYATAPVGGAQVVVVNSGQALTGQNFFDAQYGSISGTLYNDQNTNGTRDAGEPALPGFAVFIDLNGNQVYDSGDVLATADSNGHYVFNNLKAGNYTLFELPAAGWVNSGVNAAEFTIHSGDNFTQDWAFTQNAIVRGFVFADKDANGFFTEGDTPLIGWTVYADLNNNGVLDPGEPAATTTTTSGSFQLALSPGTYTLREVTQGAYHVSAPAAGSYTIVAAAGSFFGVEDFANVIPGAISGIVYNDLNGTGTLQPVDPGVANWQVYVDSNNNGRYDPGEPTAFTNAAGAYTISGVLPGSRTLREVIPFLWYATSPISGSRTVSVPYGQSATGQNFLNTDFPSISGTLYNDQNGNGVRDPGEPPLPGFKVYIDLNHDNVPDGDDLVATADAGGSYLFNNLNTGISYTVLEVPVNGWQNSGVSAAQFVITSGANFTQDWAFTQEAVVRGIVFTDNDNNGTFSSGDTALSGRTVYADLNGNGALDAGEPSAITGSNGLYQLGLAPGTYTLREVAQDGDQITAPAGGAYTIVATAATLIGGENFANVPVNAPASISGTVYNGTTVFGGFNGLADWQVYLDTNNNGQYDAGEPAALTDSTGAYTIDGVTPGAYVLRDVVPAGWYATLPSSGSRAISLAAAESLSGQNFGNGQYGSISGTLYNDVNGDGIYESNEPVLPGYQLFMDRNGDGVFDQGDVVATSGTAGQYRFSNLTPGQYSIWWVPVPGWQPSFQGGAVVDMLSTTDFVQDRGLTQLSIASGLINGVPDRGNLGPSDPLPRGWAVYADLNNNGILDPGEPSVAKTTYGFYHLGLSAGAYTIRLEIPAGYLLTYPSAESYSVDLGALDYRGGLGFDAALAGTIAGSVFDDLNHNGVLDSGEPGIAGRTVYLDANNNGILDPGEISTTTGAAGAYLLSGVPPGAATVREVLPAGWARTAPLAELLTLSVAPGAFLAGPTFGDVQLSTVPLDFNYLLTLAQHYGQQGTFASGDLNADDQVNFNDLLILAQNYGHALPSAASDAADVLRLVKRARR